jgi:signal transduction histidine kinase
MRVHRPRPTASSRLRRPRRTARLRLTILYGGVCLLFGIVLLAVTYLLTLGALQTSAVPQPAAASQQQGGGPGQPSQPQSQGEQTTVDRQLLLTRSGIALLVVSAGAVGAGWLLAGRVLRPLGVITTAARRISASNLHERLALTGPDDELKELGDTLDALFARLEDSFDAQRRFAANASHELRTPLTRERTLLQVTLADPASTAGTWQAISKELLASNAEQEHLIEALLTLASSESGLAQRQPVDLAAMAGTVLAAPRPGIGQLGLTVRADLQPAALEGDLVLVQQLVTNLVDNAVRHNIAGGDIQVGTATIGGRATVTLSNSGPAVPDSEVDRLFQPFQRLGPRRALRDNGHGLGLSIVRAVATAHGASVTAQPRAGGGLTIDVTFPRSPPASAGGLTARPFTRTPAAR